MPGKIEEVNEIMLARRLKAEDSMFVFFYEEEDIFAQRLLKGLEDIDDPLDKKVRMKKKKRKTFIGSICLIESTGLNLMLQVFC